MSGGNPTGIFVGVLLITLAFLAVMTWNWIWLAVLVVVLVALRVPTVIRRRHLNQWKQGKRDAP
jgi:hypothetical protein